MICPFQLRKIDIFTGNVLNGGIVRFPKGQCVTGVRNHTARNGYEDVSRIVLDGNRMIRTWKLNLSFFNVSSPFLLGAYLMIVRSSDCEDDPAEGTALN